MERLLTMDEGGFQNLNSTFDSSTGVTNIERLLLCNDYNLVKLRACFHSVRFWQYLSMMFLANVFGGFFSYEYKPIGNSVHISDSFLAWASSASSVVQAITRLSFGALYDKFGFRPLFMTIMIVCTINSLICYPARNIEWLYFVCIQLNYFVMAGIFSTFPTPVAKTFGPRYGI